MNQSLAKYHSRSPRYILQPQDNTLIRVAGPRQIPWEEGTEIQNISLSGLAFTAPNELCPVVGEFIKIEFTVPGKPQMACHGLVIRLEPHGKSEMLVGIQFQQLEMPHRIVLLQGLAQKLKDQQDKKLIEQNKRFSFKHLKQNWRQAFIAVTLLSVWILMIQWIWRTL